MFRSVLALSMIVIASFVSVSAGGEDPTDIEVAKARAEVSVVIAKATAARSYCTAVECSAAEAKASQIATEATKQLPSKSANLSADGRTLTDAEGRIYVRQVDGTFRQSEAAGGCRVVNGQTACPTPRR